MLKDKNILYLVHNYNNFQKDPIEKVAKSFKKVYVLVRYKPLSLFAKYIPIKSINRYEDKYVIDLNKLPSNVEVIRVAVWYLPLKIFYTLLGDLHYKKAERIIEKNKIHFDLIHSHFTWTSGYVGMRLKGKYNVPLVLTIHENNAWFKEELKSKNQKVYKTWEKANTIIRVNKETIKDLKKFNNNVMFLSNGFNENLFYPTSQGKSKQTLGLNEQDKILLSIGYLRKEKGQIHLIRAMKEVVKKNPESTIKLYIIGEGNLRKMLEAEIKKLALEKHIILLGKQFHRDIPIWMNACNIFVLPSLTESFGIVQIEAFACGKPVVATKNEGSKEVIKSQDYGLLCKVANSGDLAEKINLALRKNWDKEKILKYSENFKQKDINKNLEKLYRKLF